jgi:hypothetical protein
MVNLKMQDYKSRLLMYLDQENEKFEMKMDKALNKIKSIKKKK